MDNVGISAGMEGGDEKGKGMPKSCEPFWERGIKKQSYTLASEPRPSHFLNSQCKK